MILGVESETSEVHEIPQDDEFIDENFIDDSEDEDQSPVGWIRDEDFIAKIQSHKKVVVTSAQNNVDVNQDFLFALEQYCRKNNAALVIIPNRLRSQDDGGVVEYDDVLKPYLVENQIEFRDHDLILLCGMKLSPTAVNPLAGKDAQSKGKSVIFGHPQFQLRTLVRGIDRKYPPILSTTGTVTKPNYTNTNIGRQAEFNHAYNALVIEMTDTEFFLRNLNYSETHHGFYDMEEWYSAGSANRVNKHVSAIVTGDTHVRYHDKEVYQATFGKGGLVDTLKPAYLISHDTLDFNSRSHHSTKDQFSEYAKHNNRSHLVEDELKEALDFLNQTTPDYATNVIVASNHDSHFDRWLKETDIRKDPENAKIFHEISWKMYDFMDKNNQQVPMAFEAYCVDKLTKKAIFLKEPDTFKLHDIELAYHSHVGPNGARGSIAQFTKLPEKTVIGHSHSPQVNKGCYQVGTSSIFHMGYVRGPSSWDHVHCIIYRDGKRQIIFLRNGKFRA